MLPLNFSPNFQTFLVQTQASNERQPQFLFAQFIKSLLQLKQRMRILAKAFQTSSMLQIERVLSILTTLQHQSERLAVIFERKARSQSKSIPQLCPSINMDKIAKNLPQFPQEKAIFLNISNFCSESKIYELPINGNFVKEDSSQQYINLSNQMNHSQQKIKQVNNRMIELPEKQRQNELSVFLLQKEKFNQIKNSDVSQPHEEALEKREKNKIYNYLIDQQVQKQEWDKCDQCVDTLNGLFKNVLKKKQEHLLISQENFPHFFPFDSFKNQQMNFPQNGFSAPPIKSSQHLNISPMIYEVKIPSNLFNVSREDTPKVKERIPVEIVMNSSSSDEEERKNFYAQNEVDTPIEPKFEQNVDSSELRDLHEKVAMIGEQKIDLLQKNESMQGTINFLQKELESQKTKIQELQKEREVQSVINSKKLINLEEYKEQMKKKKEELNLLRQQKEKILFENKEMKMGFWSLSAEFEKYEKKMQQKQDALKKSLEKCQFLQKFGHEKNEQLQELNHTIEIYTYQLNKFEEEKKQLKNYIYNLQENNQKKDEKISKLQNEYEEMVRNVALNHDSGVYFQEQLEKMKDDHAVEINKIKKDLDYSLFRNRQFQVDQHEKEGEIQKLKKENKYFQSQNQRITEELLYIRQNFEVQKSKLNKSIEEEFYRLRKKVIKLSDEVKKKDLQIQDFQEAEITEIERKEAQNEEEREYIRKLEQILMEYEEKINEKMSQTENLRKLLYKKQGEIQKIQAQAYELEKTMYSLLQVNLSTEKQNTRLKKILEYSEGIKPPVKAKHFSMFRYDSKTESNNSSTVKIRD